MRKREQQQQQHFFLDSIFEPPPQWRTTVAHSNNGGGNAGYHAHAAHRSPIHHHLSLSEIVYQDYSNNSEIQDVYPMYQDRRQLHQRHSFIDSSGSGSDSRLHGFENSSLSLHTISTSDQNEDRNEYEVHNYDDIEDTDSVDKHVFQRQTDNVSISNSLFTAVDHLEVSDQEEQDDASSTENLRHGYLPLQYEDHEPIDTMINKLNVQTSIVWEDYRPQYRLLNESYDNVKKEVYKEIYTTIEKMQALDHKFNKTKIGYQLEMEKDYLRMTDELISQCKMLTKQKEFVCATLKPAQQEATKFINEKVRLNIGGNMFETSQSTLGRDTNSLLATMFSGRHPISAESDGSYFIDRDPSHFRLVLNYLRDLRIPPTVLQDVKIRQELLQEVNVN
ncbi:hypothetical protein EDC94DRAFT_617498 [Helicostylum pulchrum]|nr:hypothetical protein EDC94DRAFT_617498 [Helicostylum pulchrum]